MLVPSDFVKIRVAVPPSHSEAIRKVLGEQGAGMQGKYDNCSGTYKQTGRFRPLSGAHPAIGVVGKLEEIEEEIIETICHTDKVEAVVRAIKKLHSYEEPAIDIFPRLEIK